jgi:dTDP-4-amino-4,6-dideoxygalactose transaminase
VHYPVPDHRQPAWVDDYRDVSLPVTEHAADRVLSVPCFPELTDAEIAHVCGALSGL